MTKISNYSMYVTSYFFSRIGTYISKIVIVLLIFQNTNSILNVSIYFLITSIISIFFAPLIGSTLDNFNKKNLIFLSDLFNFLVFLLFALFANLFILYVLVFINTFINLLSNTGRNSYLPEIIQKEKTNDTNHVLVTLDSTIRIISTSLGASIFYLYNSSLIFTISAFAFLISAILIKCTKTNPIKNKKHTTKINIKLLSIFNIYKEVNIDIKKILIVTITYTISLFIITIINITLPLYVTKYLKLKAAFVGYLESFIGLGTLINFIFYKLLINKVDKFNDYTNFFIGKFFVGVGILLLGFLLNIYSIFLCFFVLGFGIAFTTSYSNIIFQKYVNKDYLGRVLSFHSSMIQMSVLIATSLTPLLVNLFSLQNIYFFGGGIMIILVLAFLKKSAYQVSSQQS